ncbi:MAG: AmmeMemoRadiSam system protein B [Treponema sp.]|nr:AmmeMemoRadiSam system protein B [Treponema sp.]
MAVFFSTLIISCAKTDYVTVNSQYPGDSALWNHTFSKNEPFIIPDKMPAAMVLPHHDICTFQQNSFYQAVSSKGQPSVVVLVSPDHFESSKKAVSAPKSNVRFSTTEGDVPIEKSILKKLSVSDLKDAVDFTDEAWIQEHGVFVHMPFIHHYFPKAKVVPLILKPLADNSEFDSFKKLAEFLDNVLPEDALIVASVDFSHYQIPEVTELHDQVSLNTLANFESPRDLEIDSPESIFTLMEFCRLRNATVPVLIHRTCTHDFIPEEFVESTSHQYWTFFTDDAKTQIEEYYKTVEQSGQRWETGDYSDKNFTLVIGGSGDTGAGFRTRWEWDRYRTSTDIGEQNLYFLAGKEARFLMGFDAYIFDPEPGTVHTHSAHGTTLRVTSIDADQINGMNEIPLPDSRVKNQIEILVLNYNDRDYSRLQDEVQFASHNYDIIINRDTRGLVGAQAILKNLNLPQELHAKVKDTAGTNVDFSDLTIATYTETVDLGILKAADGQKAEGNILVVNWKDGIPCKHTFEYKSDDELPPAIHQAGFPY